MADYIEGKRAVIEALRTRVPLSCVLLADNAQRDSLVNDILRKAKQQNVAVKPISRKRLDELSVRGSHQGVMAQTKPFPYASLEDVMAKADAFAQAHEGSTLIVVLDHITDAGNLGAIARSAESAGACGILIPNKRAASVTAATYKSSAGAVSHIPIAQVPNLPSALEKLKRANFWVAAATEQAKELIWDANLKGRIALVMGNEGEGVSRLVLETCDFAVALPQAGSIGSLNVAQAFTACAYEWLRQNRAAVMGA